MSVSLLAWKKVTFLSIEVVELALFKLISHFSLHLLLTYSFLLLALPVIHPIPLEATDANILLQFHRASLLCKTDSLTHLFSRLSHRRRVNESVKLFLKETTSSSSSSGKTSQTFHVLR